MLRLRQAEQGRHSTVGEDTPMPAAGPLQLEAWMHDGELRFAWAAVGGAWQPVGPALDATLLSDEHVHAGGTWGFTGTYAVLCAQNSGPVRRPRRLRLVRDRCGVMFRSEAVCMVSKRWNRTV